MHVLRSRRAVLVGHAIGRLAALKELQARLDVHVRRVELSSALIRVKSVIGLVVAGFVLRGGLERSHQGLQ
jgi:hypothetical protein